MSTTLAPPLLRQQIVDLCVELRAHADPRAHLRDELLADDYLGERLTVAVLYAALDRPGMGEHVAVALDMIGSYAEHGGDRALVEHRQRCGFAVGHPDCTECEQHWQTLLDEAVDHLLDDVLTRQAVEDLGAVAA